MKRIYDTRLFRLTGLFLAILVWLAHNSNPDNAKTGAPFDGHCNTCHNGSNPGGFDGTVDIGGLPAVVSPNTVYPLTITMTPTAGSPTRGGFQAVFVDNNNANCGNLAAGNAQSGTEFAGTREYIEHRGGKNFNGGPISWSFNWTSPGTVGGNIIKVYFVGNFTNGNSQSSGDYPIEFLQTFDFAGPPPVTALISNITNVNCFGASTGSLTVEPDGGVPPYTYLWSNGQTSQTAINLAAGNYTVTATASGGSGSAVAGATVTQPPQLAVSATVSNTITCLLPTATITATASGGTPGYEYAWSNGQTGSQTDVTSAGTYSVTTTDNNGCTKVAMVNVTSNTVAPVTNAGPDAAITCAQPSTTLNGAGSSSGASFTYLWTTTNGHIVSGGTTLTPTVNAAGDYKLVVTNNNNGCTSSDIAVVTSSIVAPTATTTGGQITCAQATVQITVTTNASQPTFAWTGPNGFTSTLQNPTVGEFGTYNVVVTNTVTGCSATATASVTQNTTPPTVLASATGVLTCSTQSIALSGSSSAGVYSWTGPNGFTSSLQNPMVMAPGTYTLSSTGSNGCTSADTAVVTQNIAAPSATASANGQLTCVVSSVQLNGGTSAPNPTFAWTGPNGFTSTQQNPNVQAAGTYTLVVTSGSNGCTASATATVTENKTPPGATASANGQLTCVVSSVQLNGGTSAPNPTFAWTGPNGFTSTQQNPNVQALGTYSLVVTSGANGCTSTASTTVTENKTPPTASAVTPVGITCVSPTVQLNGTGSSQGASFSYLWTTANGHIVSGSTTLTPVVDAPGTYSLLVTNSTNGCTANAGVTVTQNPPVSASIGAVVNVSCNGSSDGSATATATGGNGTYSYLWSTGASTAAVSALPAGTYSATVTDGENCTSTSTVTITQPLLLAANATATGETAAGAHDGTATAAPSGGTSPYSYLWSTSGTTASITNLAPGNYTVSITDQHNCTAVQTVTVNSFNCALSATISSQNVHCNGASDGTSTVNLSGAALPVVYLWSNGATTQSVSGLAPGTYTVQITDANNCPALLSTSITEPPALLPNANATGETAAGAHDGTATAQPTGGAPAYGYSWSTGATTASIVGLAPGVYSVVVSDVNGCSASQTVTVNAFNCAITANFSTANVTCNGLSNGQATVTLSGGSLPFSYIWSNGDTTATADQLAAGTYSVTIVDANNCLLLGSATITQPDLLVTTVASVTNVACPEDHNGAIVLNTTGGTLPYSTQWSSGLGGQNLAPGTYFATVTDGNGCSNTQTATVVSTDNTPPVLNCPVVTVVNCPGVPTVYDQPTASDNCNLAGAQPVLTGGLPSGSIFGIGTTVVSYFIQDVSGNTATCSFAITVSANPAIVVDQVVNESNQQSNGSISISIEGGAPATYEWEKDGVFFSANQDLTGLSAGTYSLVVTFLNGCTETIPPVVVEGTIGIWDPAAQAVNIRIVPNPTRTTFHLETSGLEVQKAGLYDMQGRLVQDFDNTAIVGEVSIAEIPAGLYYLVVSGENGYRHALKLFKID